MAKIRNQYPTLKEFSDLEPATMAREYTRMLNTLTWKRYQKEKPRDKGRYLCHVRDENHPTVEEYNGNQFIRRDGVSYLVLHVFYWRSAR